MRKYIASLPQRPDQHKRHFSYVVSALFTLFIFLIWSLVNFGMPSQSPVAEVSTGNLALGTAAVYNEPSPLSGLGESFANMFKDIKESLGQGVDTSLKSAKTSIENIDVNQGYTELRNQALDQNYGQ